MSKSAWSIVATFLVVGIWRMALAAGPIQTQMAMAGDVEVDVVKAAVQEGILTVVLSYRNTGKANAAIRARLEDTYYIDDTDKKKYQVLRDSKNDWIAAPLYANSLNFDVGPGEKKAAWFKFPAPAEKVKAVNLVVPGILPFEKLPIAR